MYMKTLINKMQDITAEIVSNNNGVLELYILKNKGYMVVSADKHNTYLKDKLVKGAIIRILLSRDNKVKRLIVVKEVL